MSRPVSISSRLALRNFTPTATGSPPPKKPIVGALAALVGMMTAAALVTEIPKDEGIVLRGYLDPVGIPTKCMGDTQNVVVGRRYTLQECREGMERQLIAHAKPILACAPSLKTADPYVRYAAISYAYNAGTGRFCRQVAPYFNRGDMKGGCRALGTPTTARGVRLPGLVKRRAKEVAVCLKGVAA